MKFRNFKAISLLIIFVGLFSNTTTSFQIPNHKIQNFESITNFKIKLEKVSLAQNDSYFESSKEKTAEYFVKSLIPVYMEDGLKASKSVILESTILQTQLSPLCLEHLEKFRSELKKIVEQPMSIFSASTWVLQMIDSWGKLPTEGMLSGHLNAYGDWDECVNIKENFPQENTNFRGKYCWTYLIPNLDFGKSDTTSAISSKKYVQGAGSLEELIDNMLNPVAAGIVPSVATCVPSTCSTDDVRLIMADFFKGIPLIEPFVQFCHTSEKPDFSTGSIVYICILSVLAALILTGSIVDVILNLKKEYQHFRRSILAQVLISFSLVTNIKKWQNTDTEGGFGCIHGLRFFSTCWVVLCHTIMIFFMQRPSWNALDMNHIYERGFPIYFALNGYYSVDTFFTMSGLLACYSIIRGYQKVDKNLDFLTWIKLTLKMYLHRYLRLTPTYGLIVGFFATLYSYLGTGPGFSAPDGGKNCRKFWWHNLLYINNVIHYNATAGEEMCEGESWYISNDMQFFILAPLFVILLWKRKIIGMAVLASACVTSILVPAITVGTEKLPPVWIYWKSSTWTDEQLYNAPWHRIGPYLVGMWMGYALFKIGKKQIKLPKIVVLLGWSLSTATALSLIFGLIPYFQPDNDDSAVGAAFYAGFGRFSWGIVICWIIFACQMGYGGWVNSFLSLKVFMPLGRLTFCVYLTSFSTQMLLQYTIRQPMLYEDYRVMNLYFSHLVMCFLVGFVLTMTLESPFIALEKVLFGGVTPPFKELAKKDLENGASTTEIISMEPLSTEESKKD